MRISAQAPLASRRTWLLIGLVIGIIVGGPLGYYTKVLLDRPAQVTIPVGEAKIVNSNCPGSDLGVRYNGASFFGANLTVVSGDIVADGEFGEGEQIGLTNSCSPENPTMVFEIVRFDQWELVIQPHY